MSVAGECRSWRPSLTGYLLGDLNGRQRRRLAAHLGRCRRCRDELAELGQVVTALEASRPGHRPPATDDRPPTAV